MDTASGDIALLRGSDWHHGHERHGGSMLLGAVAQSAQPAERLRERIDHVGRHNGMTAIHGGFLKVFESKQ